MTPEQNLKLLHRIFSAIREADLNLEGFMVMPHVDGTLIVAVNCSDVFGWACADSEEITEANIDIFVETATELATLDWQLDYAITGVGIESAVSTLFACRSRNRRPFLHGGKYGTTELIRHLIERLPEK